MSRSAWEGTPSEDLVSQNQLTLVTVVQPERLQQLRAVLDVIDLYARHLAEQGSLVGISTIHTVRWALLDGGKRLLMASNYDGTWENYIDEFAELILSGLDSIWDSSYGFPELGAQDVAALQALPALPPGAGECILQRLPGSHRTEYLVCHTEPARPVATAMNQGNRLTPEAKADIQGFITSAYGHLPASAYLFLEIGDRPQAQQWLKEILPSLTTAASWRPMPDAPKLKPERALNLAFTYSGLGALGMSETVLHTFPPSSAKAWRRRSARGFWGTQARAPQRNGSWAVRRIP